MQKKGPTWGEVRGVNQTKKKKQTLQVRGEKNQQEWEKPHLRVIATAFALGERASVAGEKNAFAERERGREGARREWDFCRGKREKKKQIKGQEGRRSGEKKKKRKLPTL